MYIYMYVYICICNTIIIIIFGIFYLQVASSPKKHGVRSQLVQRSS